MELAKNKVPLQVFPDVPVLEGDFVQRRRHVLSINGAHVRALARDAARSDLPVVRARIHLIAGLELQPLALVRQAEAPPRHVDLPVAVVVDDLVGAVLRDGVDAAGVERRREAEAALYSHVLRDGRAAGRRHRGARRDGRRLRDGGRRRRGRGRGVVRPLRREAARRGRVLEQAPLGARRAQHRAGPVVVARHGGRRVVGGAFAGVGVRREDVLPLDVRGDAVVEAYRVRRILPSYNRRRGHGAAVGPPRVDSRTRVHGFRLLLAGPPQPSEDDAGLRLAVVIGNVVRAVVVRFRDGARVKGRRVAVAALDFGPLRQRLVAPLSENVAPLELLRRIVVEDDGVRVALDMLDGRRAHFPGAVPRVDGVSLL